MGGGGGSPMSHVDFKNWRMGLSLCFPMSHVEFKAYIPLQRKIPGVRGWRRAMPPTPEFCVGHTNMLVYFGVT